MIQVFFLLLAFITIYLSIKLSYYADLLSKTTNTSNALIGGILLAGITSLPEFVTCITAIFCDNPYLAIGDIFGSNFFNITMICFFDIIFIKKMFFKYTSKSHNIIYILLIINYIIIYIFMNGTINYSISNIDIPTISIIVTYCIYLFFIKKSDSVLVLEQRDNINSKKLWFKFIITSFSMIIISILLTLIVNKIATLNIKFSSSTIGAILLGITTSLPEVITFLTLIKLNAYDLALSNIIGSNLFNLLVLATGDIFLKYKSLYFYSDKDNLKLLLLGLFVISISFYQNNCKKNKNKILYILPSIIIVTIYILFWIM